MGEPKKLTCHNKEDKKRIAVNLGNGGGIGVGIIFLGGALATAALVSAVTVGRRLLQSSNSKNRNHCPSTGSTETAENFITENIRNKDESKKLQFFPLDSFLDMHENLSNGTAKTSATETDTTGIFTKSFFSEEKDNLEPYGGKGDLICDDEEILISSGLHGSDSSTQYDGAVEADHSALIIPQSSEEQESTLVDHDQYSNSTDRLLLKSNVFVGQDFVVPALNSSSLCRDEELNIDCEKGTQAFETVETSEGDKAVEAVHADEGQGNCMILMLEEEEKKCDQHEDWLTTETAEEAKRGETVEVAHADPVNAAILMVEEEEKIRSQHDVSVILQTVEVLKRDEKLDADQADKGNSSNVILMFGEEEKKSDQQNGAQTMENDPGWDEDKALEPAQGKDKTELGVLEEEISAPHDHESDTAGELADGISSISSNNLKKQLTEEQENLPVDVQEDNCVFNRGASENVTCESYAAGEPNMSLEALVVPSEFKPGIGFENNFKEVDLSPEASDVRKENAPSEPASEDRVTETDSNPLEQSIVDTSEEIEDTSATTEGDMGVSGQMQMSEEDSNDDDTDDSNMEDRVEVNSEGTGDSSIEYNTEAIWPAESLEKLSMELTELKLNNQKEEQQAEENKELQTEGEMHLNNVEDHGTSVQSLQNINKGKDNSKMTFLEKYMLELAEQNDQQTNSLKPRSLYLTWMFMVLLWPLCFWYFGLPFLKISLIVILSILLSKIQGT